jgi:hypothetical protein
MLDAADSEREGSMGRYNVIGTILGIILVIVVLRLLGLF